MKVFKVEERRGKTSRDGGWMRGGRSQLNRRGGGALASFVPRRFSLRAQLTTTHSSLHIVKVHVSWQLMYLGHNLGL